MRFLPRTLLVSLALLAPSLAHAQDAGFEDGGAVDAGSDDAGGPSDAAGPDATATDDTDERCLDGYDRSYVDACSGKQAGAACTFPGGESGQCAALRCLTAAGEPVLVCVATTGMAAPPPRLLDAGLADGDGGTAGADYTGTSGGGCTVGAPLGAGSLGWSGLAVAALLARGLRRRR